MRLNIACGANYADGWVNVDRDDQVKAEFHADAADLPFATESVELVYLGNLIESTDAGEARMILLEAQRVLRPGGFLATLERNPGGVGGNDNPYLWDFLNSGFDPQARDQYLAHRLRFNGDGLYLRVSDVFPESVTYLVSDLVPEWPVLLQPPWLCAVLASKPR